MSNNTLVTLNQNFLCFTAEDQNLEVGQTIAKYDEQLQNVALEDTKIQGLARNSFAGLGITKNPVFLMFTELQKVGRYFAGDFVPISEDQRILKNVKRIWVELIYRGYFGEVWICNSEAVRNAEKEMVIARGDDGLRREYFPESPIRLFVREQSSIEVNENGRKVNKTQFSFKSVGTGCAGLDLSGEKLVRASANGMYNFYSGGQILLDYFGAFEAFVNCFYTSIKTIIADVQDKKKYDSESEQLMRGSETVFMRHNEAAPGKSAVNENEYEEFTCFPIESVKTVLKNIEMGRDHRATFLGMFSANIDGDKDRDNVAQTNASFKLVNNIQKSYLINLECLCRDLIDELKFPKDFKIVLSSNKPHMENDPGFYNMQEGKFSNQIRHQMNQEKFMNKDALQKNR